MSSGGGGDGATSAAKAAAALKKGPWTAAEDATLVDYVTAHGEGNWNAVQKFSSLRRCGKSCRLRWANYLRPNLKKGSFSPDEEFLILKLHAELGNKWARMASQLPGRTDNEIKNYWNTRVKQRTRAGLPLYPPEIEPAPSVTGKQFRSKPVLDLSAIKGFRADGLTFQFPISPISPQTPPPIFHHQIHPLLQQQQFHLQQQQMKQQQFHHHQQQMMMMHPGFDSIEMNIIPPRSFSTNIELPSNPIRYNVAGFLWFLWRHLHKRR